MIKNLFIILAFCFFQLNVQAQVASNSDKLPLIEQMYLDLHTALPKYIKFESAKVQSLEDVKTILLEKIAPSVRNKIGFQFRNSTSDKLGIQHDKYQITYNDIPITGATIILHKDQNGIASINGKLFSFENIPTKENLISKQAAVQAALAFLPKEHHWQLIDNTINYDTNRDGLTYVSPNLDFKKGDIRLARKLTFVTNGTIYDIKIVYINAKSGRILGSYSSLCTNGEPGIANTKYSGEQEITTHFDGINYVLSDYCRGEGIHTLDLLNRSRPEIFTAALEGTTPFYDRDNIWNNVNSRKDEVATDVHWGIEKSYDYFFNIHGRHGIDDQDSPIYSLVHHQFDYTNAFWNGNYIGFGDGNESDSFLDEVRPFTTPDICGHEYTHGVTQHAANLIYTLESGALNESFSDIFGYCIHYFADPARANFLVAEEASPNNQPIRDMANPNSTDDPDTYHGAFWVDINDFQIGGDGGVHTNSGVQNYWFALLVQGGNGTNDNNYVYNITPIGLEKAAKIAYRTLSVYLTETATYQDAYFYSIQATNDLYGACSDEVSTVIEAWQAVGLPQNQSSDPFSFQADRQHICNLSDSVQFINPANPAWNVVGWNFGDGETSSATSPLHHYSQEGIYDVLLIAENSCTNETFSVFYENYITVSMADCPPIEIQETDYELSVNGCSGALHHESDPSNIFPNFPFQSEISIEVPDGNVVELLIPEQAENTNIIVYTGSSTDKKVFANISNDDSFPISLIIPDNHLVILVRGLAVDDFNMSWTCFTPSEIPVANFSAHDTLLCSNMVNFKSISEGLPTTYLWDFGDGESSNEFSPTHEYEEEGSYTISLIVCNNQGCDTLIKENYISIALDNSISCDTIILPPIGAVDLYGCNGFVVDPGGIEGDYEDSNNSQFRITVPEGKYIGLTFHLQDFISPTDYVGPTFFQDRPGYYTGLDEFGNSIIYVLNNTIEMIFEPYDDGLTGAGFLLEWTCIDPSNSKPIALYNTHYSDNTTSAHNFFGLVASGHICGKEITFRDSSIFADEVIYSIDGQTYEETPFTHSFDEAGEYELVVIATNAVGADTLIKTINVYFNEANFSILPGDVLEVGEELILEAADTDIELHDDLERYSYYWYLGDDTSVRDETSITKTYDEAGVYTIRLLTAEFFEQPYIDISCIYESIDTITVENTTSVEDPLFQLNQVNLYPIPADDLIYLSIKSETHLGQSVDFQIIDMQGRIVQKISKTLEPTQAIGTKKLSDGVYALVMNFEGHLIATERFIVQKK